MGPSLHKSSTVFLTPWPLNLINALLEPYRYIKSGRAKLQGNAPRGDPRKGLELALLQCRQLAVHRRQVRLLARELGIEVRHIRRRGLRT
jgi:hypothetical protein